MPFRRSKRSRTRRTKSTSEDAEHSDASVGSENSPAGKHKKVRWEQKPHTLEASTASSDLDEDEVMTEKVMIMSSQRPTFFFF